MPETNLIDKGQLRISAVSEESSAPIDNASIEISPTGEPDRILERLTTDNSGNSDTIELDAPPVEYSLEPGDNQPYSEYNLKITARDMRRLKSPASRFYPASSACPMCV